MAAERARACLQNIRNQITFELGEYPDEHHYMQKKLTGILQITIAADQEIARVQPKPKAQAILSTGKPSLLVPADLLFQIYYSLFPAERMMVISGRRTGDTVVLGAAFDVTGVASGGHVSADPALLARALISMDLSDTYLAAWIHSHPGRGIQATFPSKIDLRQHAEWIQNYSSHLLSAIIVQDRYIRFWGTALEAEDLTLSVQLPGLTQEDGNDHVYRLIN
jgi:proteasome lid subunit RPN8/RPN11